MNFGGGQLLLISQLIQIGYLRLHYSTAYLARAGSTLGIAAYFSPCAACSPFHGYRA